MVLDASATANYKNKKVKTIVVNTNNIILFEFSWVFNLCHWFLKIFLNFIFLFF